MSGEVEQRLERQETSIKEIRELFFDSETSHKVFMNEVKHLMEAVKGNVETIKSIHEVLVVHGKQLEDIEIFKENKMKVYKFFSQHVWKIIGAAIFLATTFDIVRQLPYK